MQLHTWRGVGVRSHAAEKRGAVRLGRAAASSVRTSRPPRARSRAARCSTHGAAPACQQHICNVCPLSSARPGAKARADSRSSQTSDLARPSRINSGKRDQGHQQYGLGVRSVAGPPAALPRRLPHWPRPPGLAAAARHNTGSLGYYLPPETRRRPAHEPAWARRWKAAALSVARCSTLRRARSPLLRLQVRAGV